jgi:seryl-tRNA(Sec) selenium transferase
LHERGLLASVDAGRQMLLVRRTLEGIPRQILHLKARDLVSFSTD